ncbi:MAG: NAD(P)H-dependent oxidoreductase [Microvirga sp.]
MASKLHVIICSTRPTRIGPAVAQWFYDEAVAHGRFDVELVDLADFNLPVFDEPEHPRLRRYQHAHTKAWSAKVEEADAFVFVTPEYNFGPPPSLINALNYLVVEWHYKPASFVSYGGVSGGLRAVQVEKQLLTTFKVMPIPEAVAIPMVAQYLDDNRVFNASDITRNAVKPMLDELARWTDALKPLRSPVA